MYSTISFSTISNASNDNNFNFSNNVSNNVSTQYVRSGGYVRKPCDWSRGLGLTANRNAADRKRKSESEICSSVQAKKRRPGQ